MPIRSIIRIPLLALGIASAGAAVAAEPSVHVNGVRLPHEVVVALENAYRTTIADGRYWYDPYSGLWGREGGAAVGRIDAGFDFGAPLAEDASGGNTRVIVNGRRLPASELRMLEWIVGPVLPGRYWLDAYGNAGFEGGPPLVNIVAAHRASQAAPGGWNRNTPGGNWGGDGDCSYYSHPDGPSVMIGAC